MEAKSDLNITAILNGFPQATIETISSIHLPSYPKTPPETLVLWSATTSTHPLLFPSQEAWTIDPPAETALVLATLDHISSPTVPVQVFRREEIVAEVDPRLAIAQLMAPDQNNPITLPRLPILPENALTIPPALSETLESFNIQFQSGVSLTPKYASTDLYIVASDSLSIPIGSCALWICFPPTPLNLSLLTSSVPATSKLPKLEGGIAYHISSTEALFLPAGTIHTSFTIHGGFLASLEFNTPLSCLTFAKMLAAKDVDAAQDASLFAQLISSISLALTSNKSFVAITAWLTSLPQVRRYVASGEAGQAWRREAEEIWNEFFTLPSALKTTTCPCSSSLPKFRGAGFERHWWREHCPTGPGTGGMGTCTTRSASLERRERKELRLKETTAAVLRLKIAKDKAKRRKAIEMLDARVAELESADEKGLSWLGRGRRSSVPEVRARGKRGDVVIQVSPPSPTSPRKRKAEVEAGAGDNAGKKTKTMTRIRDFSGLENESREVEDASQRIEEDEDQIVRQRNRNTSKGKQRATQCQIAEQTR